MRINQIKCKYTRTHTGDFRVGDLKNEEEEEEEGEEEGEE